MKFATALLAPLMLAAGLAATCWAEPMPDDVRRGKAERAEAEARWEREFKERQALTRKLAATKITREERAVYDKVRAILNARDEIEDWKRWDGDDYPIQRNVEPMGMDAETYKRTHFPSWYAKPPFEPHAFEGSVDAGYQCIICWEFKSHPNHAGQVWRPKP